MSDNKKYLDLDGLSYFWSQVRTKLDAKVDKVSGKGLSTNDYTTDEKTKLGGIAAGAEVNQNAFSKVKVGTTTISSNATTDTIEFAASDGVTLTPDATGKKVTIKMSGAGAVTGGSVTNSTISGGTVSNTTLSGTITNSGTISGGTLSGATLSGTTTAAANSSLDLDEASSVLVPTAAAGDNSTKAASTAFVKTAVDNAVSTITETTNGLNTRLGTAEGEIDALQAAVNTLNGEATVTGSVKKTVADEIAKVVAGADEDFDTLKEVADWIASDTSGAAKMQTDISTLNTNLNALDAKTVDGPSSSTDGTVVLFDGTTGKLIKDSKLTIQSSVPANAVFSDTTYTGSNGITLTGTNFTNSGVRSVATGTANGTISVNTDGTAKDVAVKGLGTAAYKADTYFATAGHNHDSITGKAATAGTADQVANAFTISIGTNTTEGTGKYTFNGSAAKALNIVAGSNVQLTPAAGKLTISATDTVYTHPTFTSKTSGLYKITVNGEGHVSATTAVAKSDITALGIPAQDTTYSEATTSAAGLMSASDKTNLNNVVTICTVVPTVSITTAEIDAIVAGEA